MKIEMPRMEVEKESVLFLQHCKRDWAIYYDVSLVGMLLNGFMFFS